VAREQTIRQAKALPPISEGEVPYELPERWVWTRFQTIIFEGLTGLERAKRFQSLDNQFDYFKMNNIGDNGACSWVNMVRVDANKEEVQKYKLRRGDFLFNTRNSYELVGKTCIIDKDPIEPLLFNNNILKVDFGGKLDTIYINLMFNSPVIKELLNNKKSSTTNVAAIYQGKLMELLVIIPPLAEQKAIVAKVNRLMTWCDELEAQVEQRQELLNQTMQAVKREALADTQEKESPPALAAESQAAYQNTP
jgi:type I restriction enzyme S subunit